MGTGRLEPLAAAFVVGVPLLKPGGKPGSSGGQMPGPAADIALGIDGVARGYYRKESPCRLGVREWRGVYSALAVQGGRSGVARAARGHVGSPFRPSKVAVRTENEARGNERGMSRKGLAGRRGLTRRVSALKNRAPGERRYRDSTQTSAIRSFLLPKHACHPGALDRSTKSMAVRSNPRSKTPALQKRA